MQACSRFVLRCGIALVPSICSYAASLQRSADAEGHTYPPLRAQFMVVPITVEPTYKSVNFFVNSIRSSNSDEQLIREDNALKHVFNNYRGRVRRDRAHYQCRGRRESGECDHEPRSGQVPTCWQEDDLLALDYAYAMVQVERGVAPCSS